jgi:hypothetical protein
MVWGASSLCRWSVFRPGGCLGARMPTQVVVPGFPALSRKVPFAGMPTALVFYALCFKFARPERLQAPFIHSASDAEDDAHLSQPFAHKS